MAKSTHLGRASQALWHLSLPIAKPCGNLPWRQYGNVQSPLGCSHGGLVAIRSSPLRGVHVFLNWSGYCLYETCTSPPDPQGGGGEGEGGDSGGGGGGGAFGSGGDGGDASGTVEGGKGDGGGGLGGGTGGGEGAV